MLTRTNLAAAALLLLPLLGSCTMASPEEQRRANEVYLAKEGLAALEAGQAAPDLAGATLDGQPAQLSALLEAHTRGLVFCFTVAPDTPNSLRDLQVWQQRSAKLQEKGVGVVAVVSGDESAARNWLEAEKVGLPWLADPQGTLSRNWGCLGTDGTLPQRTTVVVGPDGLVKLFQRGQATEQDVAKALELPK